MKYAKLKFNKYIKKIFLIHQRVFNHKFISLINIFFFFSSLLFLVKFEKKKLKQIISNIYFLAFLCENFQIIIFSLFKMHNFFKKSSFLESFKIAQYFFWKIHCAISRNRNHSLHYLIYRNFCRSRICFLCYPRIKLSNSQSINFLCFRRSYIFNN